MDCLALWKLFFIQCRNEWQLMVSSEGRKMSPDISINAETVQTWAVRCLPFVFRLFRTKLAGCTVCVYQCSHKYSTQKKIQLLITEYLPSPEQIFCGRKKMLPSSASFKLRVEVVNITCHGILVFLHEDNNYTVVYRNMGNDLIWRNCVQWDNLDFSHI